MNFYFKIKKVKDVKKIEKTSGYYDFVVELESKNEEHLKRVVPEDVRNIEAIRSALTLIMLILTPELNLLNDLCQMSI